MLGFYFFENLLKEIRKMFSFGSIQSKKSKNIPHTYLFLLLSLFIASSGCSPETEIAGHKVCEGEIGKLIYIECPSGKSSADNSTTAGSGGGGIAGRIIMFDVGAINSSGEIFLIAKEAPDVTSPQQITKLFKYSASGSLDSTFGTNGELDVDSILPSQNYYYPPVIDSSGNFYTAYNDAGTSTFHLLKFDSSGNLDSNFGTNGKKTITGFVLSGFDVNASKIAVVGYQGSGYIAQLSSSDGSFDTGFDTTNSDGIVDFRVGGVDTAAYEVSYDSNGKIVVGGTFGGNNTTKVFIGRFKSNGDLDNTTFDSSDDGFYTVDNTTLSNPNGATGVGIDGLAVTSDDKIFLGIRGNFPASLEDTCDIHKLNDNGSLDTSFDSDGKLSVGSSNSIDRIFQFDVNSNDDLYFRDRKNSTYDFSGGGFGEIVSKVDGSGTYSSVKDDFDGTPHLFTGPVGSTVVAIDEKSSSGGTDFIYRKLVD